MGLAYPKQVSWIVSLGLSSGVGFDFDILSSGIPSSGVDRGVSGEMYVEVKSPSLSEGY